jgi:hypothetical protein
MDQSSNPPKNKFSSFLKIYTLVSIILLSVGLIVALSGLSKANKSISDLQKQALTITTNEETGETIIDACGDTCQAEIKSQVAAVVKNLPTTKPVATQKPVTQTQTVESKKTGYLPLAGPITTTSTSWVDAVGTEFYLDLINDYNQGATATWEAFLKVANANGTAYARLYDVTHNIAVNGSEVKIENKDISTQVISGALSFWAGRNQYRVQIKSLNSLEVTFGSGRVRITY